MRAHVCMHARGQVVCGEAGEREEHLLLCGVIDMRVGRTASTVRWKLLFLTRDSSLLLSPSATLTSGG